VGSRAGLSRARSPLGQGTVEREHTPVYSLDLGTLATDA